MSPEQNKQIALRMYEEIMNRRDTALVDQLMDDQYFNPENAPGVPQGKEGGKIMFEMWNQAFPDYKMTVQDVVVEGDAVVVRWSFTGTNTGAFLGMPATNKKVTVGGINMLKFKNGKIAENLPEFDKFGMMQQLGLIPA